MLRVTVIFTVTAALSLSVHDIECRSLPGLDVRDLLKSLKNQLELNQLQQGAAFSQKNNGFNEGLDFEESDIESHYGSLNNNDLQEMLRQGQKQRLPRLTNKLKYRPIKKQNIHDELFKLIGDKTREVDEYRVEKNDFSDLSKNSNVYLILNQEAVKQSKHKKRLNDVLMRLLGNERPEQRRYKGFVMRDDTDSRRLNTRNKDSGEEEEDWLPFIRMKTFVEVPFPTLASSTIFTPVTETSEDHGTMTTSHYHTIHFATNSLLQAIKESLLMPPSNHHLPELLPQSLWSSTLLPPSLVGSTLFSPLLDWLTIIPPSLLSPTLVPSPWASPSLVPSTLVPPILTPQLLICSTLVPISFVPYTLVSPTRVSSPYTPSTLSSDNSYEKLTSKNNQKLEHQSTIEPGKKYDNLTPKNNQKLKHKQIYWFTDYYRITDKHGYPYGMTTSEWYRRIGVDRFSDYFRRRGGRVSDEREYRPKRGRSGDRGGGGGSGRTAIPYIRHHGDIYERDD